MSLEQTLADLGNSLKLLAKRVRRLETRAFNPTGDGTGGGSGGGGVDKLRDLLDVEIKVDTPENNDVLTYDQLTAFWKSRTVPRNLDDLGDVNAPSPADKNALIYNSSSGKWIAGQSFAGGIWLFNSMGEIVDIYPATPTGLTNALTASAYGSMLHLPVCSIDLSFNLPSGVKLVGFSRFVSLIGGTITMGDESVIENVQVERSDSPLADVECVRGSEDGISFIANCRIIATQSGSYRAVGVAIVDAGSIEIYDSHIEGYSETGEGYGGAVLAGTGSLSHFGGRSIGSTSPYKD